MSKLAELKQSDFIAREPKQARGRAKVERILTAAEDLIREHGADGFSSPMVAEAANVPVASVYQFFPTRYAILRTLAERANTALLTRLIDHFAETPVTDWQDALEQVIDVVVDFFNESVIAPALILDNSVRTEVLDVVSGTGNAIAEQLSQSVDLSGVIDSDGIPEGLDQPRILVATVRAVLVLGYRLENTLSDHIRAEAKAVAIGYLAGRQSK